MVNVTVPDRLVPPAIALADTFNEATHGGSVTLTETEAPAQLPSEAVILAATLAVGKLVWIVKLAEICPAGTVTLAAT